MDKLAANNSPSAAIENLMLSLNGLSHARSTVRIGFQDTVTNERTGGESFGAVEVLLSILDEDTCFGAFVQIRQLGLGGGDFNKTFACLLLV